MLVITSVVGSRFQPITSLRTRTSAARAVRCEDETIGPIFMKEPPNRVDFSNTTGAVVECAARGSPPPDVIWVRADGTAVGDVPGLRQVLPNGNLVFPPFRAEDYRQEVHAQVYACLARNPVGTIHSRDVNVRAVVQQQYESEVNNEYVIRGNSAILKCSIPSFVADFVSVISWHDEQENSFTINGTKEGDVVTQYFEAEVVSEYVIRGNTAVLKCNIPSFVSDFVKVEAWVDSDKNEYLMTDDIVVNQFYEAEILKEYVIRGNAAVLKCSIPSFVADFVKVEDWIDEEGTVISHSDNLVVSQYYVTEAENEYVIRGNAAIVHCKIPSFVSDFVYVESWILDEGQILTKNNTNFQDVVSQPYEAEADNEYVIRGNAAIMKCEVPSFVSDFVFVEMWMDSEGGTYFPGNNEAVLQEYEARVNDEFVLRGNTAILKCIVPSFVADFVHVVSWSMDNETVTADENLDDISVVHQNYEPRVTDEDVLRGNAAIVKCLIPSFVSDYVQVIEWVTDDESLSAFSLNDSAGNYAVNQFYESQVYDIYVIRGNAAVFKCHLPSFVSDHVHVISWHDSEGGEFLKNEDYVVSQVYTVNLVEENVLRGNAAIFKCLIPSFVTEYVQVSSWIISEGDDETEIQLNDASINREVVSQAYTVNILEESVLRGNAAILKCHISTFVTEYVSVSSWIISEGDIEEVEIQQADSQDLEAILNHICTLSVVSQSYTVNLWEENVLRGNSAILKCHIPSFVTEYVTVTSWIISERDNDELDINIDSDSSLVVSQAYDVKFWEEYVLRGNAAVLKCQIPSYVSEYVSVVSWIVSEDDNDQEVKINETSDLVVSQAYAVNLMEEYVLRGNSAILKCHIPSFVSEYVSVISWIISEGDEIDEINLDSAQNSYEGKYLVLPSGELHIRDVGPEDGYKSYQCRTKHRLTGETRLSATKGRLVITEPIGRVPPKFSSSQVGAMFIATMDTPFSLQCPAQAFPVPVFRTSWTCSAKIRFCCHGNHDRCQENRFFRFAMSCTSISCTSIQNRLPQSHPYFQAMINSHGFSIERLVKRLHYCVGLRDILYQYSEPIGFKSPTFSNDVQFSGITRRTSQDFALLCQAQAFPVPIFRLKPTLLPFSKPTNKIAPRSDKSRKFEGGEIFVVSLESSVYLTCEVAGYPPPIFRSTIVQYPMVIQISIAEPTNKIAPRKDSAQNFEGWEVFLVGQNDVAYLKCQVAAYPAPLFRTRPKVTGDGLNRQVGRGNENLALLCEVQAYPAPLTRWYKFIEGSARKQPVVLNDRVKQVSGTLIIKEAKVDDSGKYLCVVNNSVGGESVETVLTVTAPLKTAVEPATQTVDFGRPAVFTCRYEGNPIKTITWLKDGKDMNHHDHVLRIESVKKEDKGMYQCFIRNDQESAGASAELKLGGRFEPPQIRHSFSEQTLRSGPSLRLKCVASGNPTPDIAWQLDGDKLNSGERLQIGQFVTADGNVESHLNISSVHTNDGGLYSCIASSKVGSASHSSRVNVYGLPYVRPMKKRPVVAGDTLIAHCPVAGYPIDSIVWERDGRVLPINRKQKVFPNGTLVIENVERMSDQATYTCVAKNSQGYSARGQLELQVMVPPQILPFEFGDEPANAGDMASISCAVSKGDQPLNISWIFNGQIIFRHNDLGIVLTNINKKTSILNIDSVNGSHRGTYYCVATNPAGSVNHSAILEVNVPPQITPFEFGEEVLNEGETASVSCVMSKGDLPVTFKWRFNGDIINSHNNLGIILTTISKKTSILNIEAVTAVHRGSYTCEIRNEAGQTNHTTVLSVNVPPQILPFEFGDEPANAGDTASVQCVMNKGDLPANFSWSLNGKLISRANSLGIAIGSMSRKMSILNIDSVNGTHRGVYACHVENLAGHVNHSATLEVNVLPQIHPFTFGDEPANAGDTVGIQCMVTKGDRPINITWHLNGKPMNDIPGVTITKIGHKSSSLSIDAVSFIHTGVYTCFASNQAGHANISTDLVVNVAPQVTPFDFGEEILNAGDTVSLTCTVGKGDLPLKIHWQLNDEILNSGNGIFINRNGKRISVLSIENVQHEHIGNYTCIAENEAGSSSHSALLNVNVPPQIIPFEFGEDTVNAQEMVLVTCTVSKGDLPLLIEWYFNGNKVKSGDIGVTLLNTKRTSQLSIESVTHQNQGHYTCVVRNQAGALNHTSQLFVNVAPIITPFDFDESVFFGEGVQVTCHVPKGDTPLNFKWSFSEGDVSSLSGINIINAGDRGSVLIVGAVTAKHSGNYTCTASNTVAKASHHATLNVKVAPIISPFEFDEAVFYGESIQVMCQTTKGDTPIIFTWSFGSRPLQKNDAVIITKVGARSSILAIPSVTEKHSGNYTCTASNIVANTNYTAALHVQVPPHIVPFEAEEPVFAGESVQLNCHVSKGDTPLTITWSFHGKELSSHEGITTTKIGQRTSLLTISSAMAGHSGEYSCHAANHAGLALHSTSVNVHVLPYIVPFEADESVFAGESVQLNCHVSKGDLPLDIKWHFHGFENSSSHFGIMTTKMTSRTSFLSIATASASHSGNYTCVATNSAGSTNYSTVLNVHVTPNILPFDVDQALFSGESVQMMCHISKGDTPLEIGWQFNGRELSQDLGTFSKVGDRSSVLVLPSVIGSHSGNYSCIAKNRAGTTSYTTVLKVIVVPYIIPFEVEESIFAGESVHITCHVSKGDRPLQISWSFQGTEIPYHNNMGITTTKLGEKASVLSIPTAMGQHSGNYTCTASNRAGRAHHSAVVNIHVPPHIMPFEVEESVYFGESVQMTCHASKGDRPMSISWTFEGQDLSTHSGIKTMKMAEQTSFLSIASVTGAHTGNYTCIAKNRAGEDRYSTSLHVKVPPVVQPFSFGEVALNSGQVVTAACSVIEGDHPLHLRWLFDNEPIKPRSGVTVFNIGERSAILSIGAVAHSHAGNYTCVAENEAGFDSHSSTLIINVPPNIIPFSFGEKPANVGEYLQAACTVNFGDFPLTITWTFNGQLVSQRNNNYLLSNSKRSSLLIIESVDAKHAGSYTCVGENRAGRTTHSTDLVVYVPPKIAPFSFGPEPAFLGDYFALQCIITHGDQPVKIEWTLNNQSARIIPGVRISNNDRRSSVLTIESIAASHAGLYNCTATNAGGVVSHTTELVVRVPPLIVPFTFGDIPSNPGDAVVVNCVATKGDMPLEISWTFSSETIDSNMHRDITTTPLGPRASVLTINSVSANHQGNYTCIVQNAAGRVEHAATLVVNVLPRIVPFSFESPLYAGQATQLTCLISEGDLPLDIQWYFEGRPLKEIAEVSATKIAKRASLLLIDPAGWSNSGTYTCVVRNPAGSSNYSASLEVHVPPRWILEPTDKAFAQGSDAKVECKADGFPKPQVTWKRAEGDTPGDYKDLKPNNPNVKVEDGTLAITNIQKTNEGYYLCEAVNGIGSGLSAVILISVQAPPQFEIKMRNQTARRSEPAVLQCQAKGEKPIGIIWNMNNKRLEPKSDPRYTIREEILPGGVVSDLSIRRTERSDSALFTCVATNAFGSDDTSINMIIQEVPEAPYGLKVLDKSGRTVQLSWAAPYDGNSPIKKFLIEYKRAKGNWEKDIDRVLVPGDATEAGVFSLRPATAYHIRIVAENELGTSEPSETVTIITAEEAPTGMPQDVKVDAADKHTLRVTWKPPPPQDWNGELQGYYVGYKLASSNKSFVFETVDISKESGKEHHLDILNLKTYTQYAIVVQVFNKMGSGPVSNEVRAYTAEGAPSAPPQDVLCTTLTAQTIRVSWVSPPLAAANGLIKAYKVIYGPSETWYDEKTKDTKITASSETILHGLKKFTNYSMEVLATTNGGDGVRAAPIHCQTEQDVPEAPRAVKALVMGADSILVSWRPPAQPNGVVTHYNVYTQAQNAEPHPNKVPASQTSYSATELKAGRYDFWVTASTIIGEGQPSATASCSASDKVPAKIASFDESFTATYKEDVKLPCLAVGVPPPNILWKVKGHPLEPSERVRQLPEGSLQIAGVAREDAGEYSCHVENQFGTDTVTHTLSVLAPPFPPQLSIASSSVSSLTLRLKPPVDADQSHAAGYTIHYKQEFGDWETVQIPSNTDTYTLENLFCGSRYQLYVTSYNGIGTGEASDVVIARTRGSKPPVPRAADFIEVGSSSVTLHLKQWLDGGCPMSHFVVENKKKGAAEWNQISNAVKPGGNFVVLDLEPATWYVLRITAHNNAGFNVAEYEFATLTMTGGTIAPIREAGDTSLTPEQTLKIILSHLNLIVPVIAAILVIIIAIVVVCVVKGARDHHHKDDAVYNASQAALGGGAGTLDKRGGLRDELGYIAPPNRKLPPVPGSNYNTCDRVKRQAVIMGAHSTWDPRRHHYERIRRTRLRRTGSGDTISTGMEDEICPYATFHLLGFREEMDPSKAIAFPHHHPSHAGTLAHPHPHPHHPAHSRAGSQSMPRANSRYARKNSQGGQSAIYSTAPEYDDPATCAEEDQYRARYSRPMYACGPEYDEPACCQPEDEQYTGAYGTPYSDHYGSRPSIGTRKCGGSPEPPPPPPRNANNDNNCSSSFNESKDSNEISEAECDQPRNFPVRAHTAKDGLHTEEMRKLIDRPEANTPIPQQAVHGRGLTAYDTVAV
ncbi:unnamed protein product [Pieris macdunnoughi]|uniref:Down syndrome cell adhesion molecule-like protein Dscam2 n=1 Tax=Pieris macdunnoughi TaxID=345717 RepID=A0A821SQ39_9NEOP|nr:unnamed protein product [Pieris macdunnoughi]